MSVSTRGRESGILASVTGFFPALPIRLDLAGRAAVLLSGREEMAPLARLLLDSGAALTVIDADPAAELAALPVKLVRRGWRTSDLDGAALVVAGAREARIPQARAAARQAGAIFAMPGGGIAFDGVELA